MKNIFVLITCGLLLACNNSVSKKSAHEADIKKQEKEMKSLPVTIEKLKKRNLGEAMEEYGQPLHMETFILDDALPESRIELNNYFTVEERRSESISIKETVWEKDQEINIMAWYKESQNKWIIIHALEWEKGSEF